MEGVAHLLIDQADDHFDEVLPRRNNAGGRLASQHGHQAEDQQSQKAGNQQGVSRWKVQKPVQTPSILALSAQTARLVRWC